jgi:hypothetical protein
MFDMTLDEGNDFLDELLRRSDIICGDSRPDEDCPVDGYVALTCPKCHRGKIQTTCHVHRRDGKPVLWSFEHRYGNCGEAFETGRLRKDMRLMSRFDVLHTLETPFGRFHALVGESEIQFRHRAISHKIGGRYGEVRFHDIDVDISGCSVGDVVSCRFEGARLVHYDADVRIEFKCGVSEEFAIEVGAYNPEFDIYGGTEYEKELEGEYPYDLLRETWEGFDYVIQRDPKSYDAEAFYPSGFISLGVAVMRKPYESFTFDDAVEQDLDFRLWPYWPN